LKLGAAIIYIADLNCEEANCIAITIHCFCSITAALHYLQQLTSNIISIWCLNLNFIPFAILIN